MKVTLLNGAREGEPQIDTASTRVAETLTARGWDVTCYTLRDHRISYCMGCFDCWVKTPGQCIVKDDNRDIAAEVINSDLQILVSAITFGGFSSEMKRMMDHMIPLLSPFFRRINGEVHHRMRYDRYPAMYGIGFLPTPDPTQENIFHRLVQGNAINMGNCAYTSDVWYLTDELTEIPSRIRIIDSLFEEVLA